MPSGDIQNFVFCGVFGLLVVIVGMFALMSGRSLMWWLGAQGVIVFLAISYLTFKVFEPLLVGSTPVSEQSGINLPPYDYTAWHTWPAQVDGRVKPFKTAAIEAVRSITGKSTFEGKDATAVVLQWMMMGKAGANSKLVDWEKYPFIMCPHHDLRKAIYRHLVKSDGDLTEAQLHAKFVAPADLRDSPGLKELLGEAKRKRDQDKEKASQNMTPEERKAEEVMGRLMQYDGISQFEQTIDGRSLHYDDPIAFISFDRVASGPWFSKGQLRDILEDASKWDQLMLDRMARAPQLYFSEEVRDSLRKFQDQVKAGQGTKAIDDLELILKDRSDQKVKAFEEARKAGDSRRSMEIFSEIARTDEESKRIIQIIHEKQKGADQAVSQELRTVMAKRDSEVIDDLKQRAQAAAAKGYRPDNPEFRMLHINYLENRFPNLYKDSAQWQTFPKADAEQVLASWDNVRAAYLSDDPDQFNKASQDFFQTTRDIGGKFSPYPGADTIGVRLLGLFQGRPAANPNDDLIKLENQFDQVQPFMWAWIVMLLSVVSFIASLAIGSTLAYRLGLCAYAASLAFQVFGFYARVSVSGRPPVSNMYETVIWVSFMTAVFAMILELVYRRGVIALAGALVATFGLILADQLPLALDPKISPIVAVLRSNYWLTIHVLTIVSSYAGGALAWGLGNIALGMLAFGNPNREVLKTLSKYTYKAMQIAVLLLAAGTFLGGWWAVDSWGRFWGWDPKEVWALIALVCYVIPLHARYIGWVKDFGLAVSAVLCFAAIVMSWYGVNFVLGAGLHSYGFGGGGPWWVFWAGLVNVEWVVLASILYLKKISVPVIQVPQISQPELLEV